MNSEKQTKIKNEKESNQLCLELSHAIRRFGETLRSKYCLSIYLKCCEGLKFRFFLLL